MNHRRICRITGALLVTAALTGCAADTDDDTPDDPTEIETDTEQEDGED